MNLTTSNEHRLFFPWRVLVMAALVVVLVALILPGVVLAKPHQQIGTVARCDPVSASASIDETITLDLYIEEVSALYGLDLWLTFDETIAFVLDENTSPSYPGTQILLLPDLLVPGFTLFQEADNAIGEIHYATTQINPRPPASGSGPVARFRFQALRAGTFTMTFLLHDLSDINGQPIAHTTQDCTVTFFDPLAVTISSFEASAQADHVLVAWETVSEVDNAGFNLYRSETPDGPREMLNGTLFPSNNPGGTSGAAYSWQDFTVQPDRTYYYWLEDVSLAGVATLHGPVSVDYVGPTAVRLGAVSALPAAAASLSWLWVVAGAGAALALGRRR